MESSDSIDKSWDSSSDATTTAQRSDPLASSEPPSSTPGAWMVNVTGREVVEMSHADVVSKWRNGELAGAALVWREGMESWAKLESIPAFQIVGRAKVEDKEEPSGTEDTNLVAVYERPMATLVFDEAVEDEWKGVPKTREPGASARGSASARPGSASLRAGSASTRPGSVSTRAGSVSSRPPAPEFPPLAPRVSRPSPVVPVDEPPPPPPLPSRPPRAPVRSGRPAQPTIPGGLTAPAPRPSSTPPQKSSSPAAGATSSSPLLAAIAAAASTSEPVVVATPVPAQPSVQTPVPVPAVLEEVSINARLHAMKSVSLRKAVFACVASALTASLVTGLVVGSRTRHTARPAIERPAKPVAVAVTPAPVVPAPVPTPEPAIKTETPDTTAADKVALSELEVAEKPKASTKPSKAYVWKPPRATAPADPSEKPAANPDRDDPERAVPDRVEDRSSAQPATWQDPGF
jgi:hypothetical protein